MKPSRTRRILLICAGVLGVLLLLALANYLAGAILFLSFGENPARAHFFTIEQAYQAADDARTLRKVKGSIVIAFLLSLVAPAGVAMLLRRENSDLFGKARFANRDDIRQEKLDGPKGVVIGKFQDKLLRLGGYDFVLLAAPTRTGKGVGFCVPNLLQFEDSVVVLDIKGENYNLSSEFRRRYMGNEIVYFNPFSEDTHRWNPLSYVSRDLNFRANDLMALASIVYPPNEKEPFWPDSARNLFVGIGLMVLETPELPKTIGEMLRQASGKGDPIETYLGKVLAARAASAHPLSVSCRDALNRFIGAGETALKGIVATFTAALTPFANPVIDKATSADDFDLRDVRKKKMSIYLNIPAGEVLQAGFIVNMFFSQLINENVKELPEQNPDLKYQCLMMLDEFTAMGKVAIIAKGVGYMAGYNMRLAIIIQDKTQLDSVYGKEDAHNIVSNMGAVIYFTPSQVSEAEEYSKMIGNDTVNSYSTQHSQGSLFGLKGQGGDSKTASYQSRAVMLPQELLGMSKEAQLVVRSGIPVIKADKIRYFSDPYFKERFEAVPMQTVAIGGEKRKVPVPVPRPRGDWAAYQQSIATSDFYILPAAPATAAPASAAPALAPLPVQKATPRKILPPPGAAAASAYADAALLYWHAALDGERIEDDAALVVLDLAPARGQFCWQLFASLRQRIDHGASGLQRFQYIACAVDAEQEAMLKSHPYLEELADEEEFFVLRREQLLTASSAMFANQALVVVAHEWAAALVQPCHVPADGDDFPAPLDALADMYLQRMPGTSVAFPLAAIASVEALASLGDDHFMLLASDIAVDDERAIRLGAFAGAGGTSVLPANYHALAWHLRSAGAALWQEAGTAEDASLLLALAGAGANDDGLLRQLRALLAGVHAGHSLQAGVAAGTGAAALAALQRSCHDPACLEAMLPALQDAHRALPAPQLAQWRQALGLVWDMYLPQPQAVAFQLDLAQLALTVGNLGVAREAAEYASQHDTQAARSRDMLAQVAEHCGRSDEAMGALRRLLELVPEHQTARGRLAALEQRMQQQDALPWYRRSLAQSGSLWLEPLGLQHDEALARIDGDGGRMALDGEHIACALMHERWGLVGIAALRQPAAGAYLDLWVAESFRGRRYSVTGGRSLLRMVRATLDMVEIFAVTGADAQQARRMLDSLDFRCLDEAGAPAADARVETLYYLGEEADDASIRQRLAGAPAGATPSMAAVPLEPVCPEEVDGIVA
ncbi:type IV secretory system conjugative DNA transfer family protein [Janthinobacterium violaceinigrum]|uniref:TraM recognition domain-containing protein n=1 Tax=Janthinobacterium violaceinigrum TaxID=2654252 RepID=A0A6I1HM57_9BURK|nr:type IV secretory system conjugative DNA transfer family protein [Janthinobacterium violaceinigrum]KAB8059162.1 TraM recognition domain-containing protein [Janthinobacterium violaceinigrum]